MCFKAICFGLCQQNFFIPGSDLRFSARSIECPFRHHVSNATRQLINSREINVVRIRHHLNRLVSVGELDRACAECLLRMLIRFPKSAKTSQNRNAHNSRPNFRALEQQPDCLHYGLRACT